MTFRPVSVCLGTQPYRVSSNQVNPPLPITEGDNYTP